MTSYRCRPAALQYPQARFGWGESAKTTKAAVTTSSLRGL